jgi:MFS family permease
MYLATGHTTDQVVWLSTFPSLFVGIGESTLHLKLVQSLTSWVIAGNFVVLPLGLLYGRRFITIVSTIVLLAATIGCAACNTWEQHFALRIIQGLAAGVTESVSLPAKLQLTSN